MEFKRLSDVDLVNEVSENANVLVEENGEIKKVSKVEIGPQADWNEENEASPAFILNKPTSLGGYAYYAVYGYYIARCEEPVFPQDGLSESTVTAEEFINDYKSRPIMLMYGHDGVSEGWGDGLLPVVNCIYNSYYSNVLDLVYFDGYSPTVREFTFAETQI